ncbi:MAG: F0F1 ATP synthase subunit delta [Gammaproteobacteria bacterium]
MNFDVTTFLLEIVNFLILIWLLQRFFYKPVLAAIAKRKQHIDAMLAGAQKLQEEADALRQRYENRQYHWEQEKQAALNALHREIEAERKKQLDRLHADLAQEKQKAEVKLQRSYAEMQQRAEKLALQNGARFAGLLLEQTASPELEQRMAELLLERISDLPEHCRLCLKTQAEEKSVDVRIASAYPLTDDFMRRAEQKFATLADSPVALQYRRDPELIAGLRIDIGAWVLDANLRHELKGFADIAREFD